MGAGILPIAKYNNKLYFLFGMESCNKGGWSDFGGKTEKNEKPLETALREGYEELNGFLGNYNELKKLVTNNFVLEINKRDNNYSSFLFLVDYDANICKYFNNNFNLIKDKLPHLIDKNGLFEKSKIEWFTISDLKRDKKKFRYFYQEIINIIINNEDFIKNCI